MVKSEDINNNEEIQKDFFYTIETITEKYLTYRKRKKRLTLEKAAKKGPVRDWIEAILWAVLIVFLINQYIFQLYQIPTASMEDTLLIKDRVFVNKFIYGSELYPTGPKIFELREPLRNEIIIFENPDYISKGALFDTLNRIVYMLTLSLVNLDKDENGQPRSQLFVKRAVGFPGDTIKFIKGDVSIKPAGLSEFMTESDFRAIADLNNPIKRQFLPEQYDYFTSTGVLQAYAKSSIEYPEYYVTKYKSSVKPNLIDYYHVYATFYKTLSKIDPSDASTRSLRYHYTNGIYVPEGRILPLGDNRDNSGDGRYFGPVTLETILGKGVFKFWPVKRIGFIL